MSDLDKLRTEREAVRGSAVRGRATRYSEAVDRLLGVADYSATHHIMPRPTVVTKTGLVVVGVDDTATSYTAVDHATIEAELRGWRLRLLHAQHSDTGRVPAHEEGARLLERMTDRVRAYSPTVPVSSRLVIGPAARCLLAEARDAGLIVVGHQHGLAGAVFGVSVGDRVATEHTGAVLVVRIPGWPTGSGFGSRPVVAGIDGDDSTVFAFAHAEARVRGSDLVLLHASRTPRVDRTETMGGVHMRWRYVAEDPDEALIKASDKAAALVMGRRGRSGIAGALLGSVSRSVVQHAHCPVFLVG
ncbi:universal stress protein [Paractinoplanes hotanensis]|uniref:Universal stress protein n=1 Tax=Paractinoplanes hotanensis TaxID=2906497 RepID=A0ABT0YFM1_9ACTN|nr:universal stress protein [Actinoplanes hotanensis]MCM4084861.1 universal stress protein [Actinoplanes hotanensis]